MGSEAAFVFLETHEGLVPSPFRVDQTFLTASRMDD